MRSPVQQSLIRAVIFDRDGTLIEHVPYLCDPDEVRLLPGVRAALKRLHDAGLLLFLHTNQSGVARGMFEMRAAHACNDRLINLLDLGDDLFSGICIAPETPGQPPVYRKPSPRFAQEIMQQYDLPAESLCYVGDRGSDLETATATGTAGVGVATGLHDLHRELETLNLSGRFPVCDSLASAVDHILNLKS